MGLKAEVSKGKRWNQEKTWQIGWGQISKESLTNGLIIFVVVLLIVE